MPTLPTLLLFLSSPLTVQVCIDAFLLCSPLQVFTDAFLLNSALAVQVCIDAFLHNSPLTVQVCIDISSPKPFQPGTECHINARSLQEFELCHA